MDKNYMEVDYITTYLGINFKIFDPDPKQVFIEDVAHALSHLCRYGGHSKSFYSVAQHSIAASYLVKPENAFCALLHDSTEGYMIDLPRPIKYKMGQYRIVENKLYSVIAEKFDLPLIMPEEVHLIDNLMISEYEWDYFMLKKPNPKHKEFYRRFFEFRGFEQTKNEFLDRFYELQSIKNQQQRSLVKNIF